MFKRRRNKAMRKIDCLNGDVHSFLSIIDGYDCYRLGGVYYNIRYSHKKAYRARHRQIFFMQRSIKQATKSTSLSV